MPSRVNSPKEAYAILRDTGILSEYPPLNNPSEPRPEASEASVSMKIPSAIRRTVSVVQLKFAARIALLIALAGVSLAAVMHHRPAFWIMANGHQEPRDFFATLPKAAATTGIAGTFTTFEAPDAGTAALEGTGGLAMNASGEITGVYSNQVGVYRGFVRATNGTITEFDAENYAPVGRGEGTIPVSIDSAGNIAGTYIDSNNVNHGFVRAADGTITVFGAGPLATSRNHGTVAMSINDSGVIAGFYLTQNSNGSSGPFNGFVRGADGTFTTFNTPGANTYYAGGAQVFGINAAGEVTGNYLDQNSQRHGFLLTSGGVFTEFDPPGSTNGNENTHFGASNEFGTFPVGIDGSGDVAGTFTTVATVDNPYNYAVRHGFLRAANGTITTFDPPGVGTGIGLIQGTFPFSISPSGNAISGLYSDTTGVYHGFVRNTASGAISTFDAPGAGAAGTSAFPGTVAFAVNDTGNLAGAYTDSNGVVHGFLFTPTVPAAATPIFSVAPGTYTTAQTVSISDKTAGSTIYYTLDGSTPTSQSPKYTGALTVNQTTTIRAIAEAAGFANSAVASATYTIKLPLATAPVFSPAVGTFTTIQTITLTDATKGAAIYYTLNGATPTTSSTLYTTPLTLSQTTTVKAIAAATGYANSIVASATYTINLPVAATPTVSPAAGAYGEEQLVTLASSTPGASIYYTTNTTVPTASSTKYTGPIAIDTSQTLKAITVASGYANSPQVIAAYNITGSPQVLTGLASSVAASTATLNATVGTGAQAQAWFVWGLSKTALGKSTARTNIAASTTPQSVSTAITGLTANTTYYFQPVVTSAGGTSYGAIQSFTTP